MTRATLTERLALALILLAGLGLRVWLLTGPFGEIDADEAVVGLMALQMPGELPAFYWEQHYLGTLEPVTAALLFAVVGPSAWALKLVPALCSVAFVGLVFAVARGAFGAGPALLGAAYLALPPSFFAAWSVKARGGYPEALALGTLCLLAAQRLADRPADTRQRALGWWGLLGLAAGLALWTHPMAAVLVAAAGLYLLGALRPWAASRTALVGLALPLGVAAAGFLIGLGPAIAHNLAGGFPSLRFAAEGGTEPRAALVNLWGLVRYGLPVLVGLAEGTPSRELLALDWPTRPGSSWLVTVALPLFALGVVWWHRRSLVALVAGGEDERRRAAIFVLVLLLVPPFVAVSRFANLWAEPRYALPVYAAAPLVTAIIWEVWRRRRVLGGLLMALLLGLNVCSLLASDYRLSLPTSAGASTAANRAELIAALQARDIDRIYTDYWLAYPLAFESRERIVPSVWSSGFGRRAVYSHLVSVAERPAFVFAQGTPGDAEFQARLAGVGGRADRETIAVYHVYTHVEPLEPLRKP
ncbi:MAG: glycosyltransferase family 39 protein [Chloroflexi bacterium]|nr:glycosyltransferase family 39 protein [Chloroflexota bacterium]